MMGAVLAGGQSSRFGSDKALAEIDGVSLLDRARSALGGWCETVVVVGGNRPEVPSFPDWPAPGMGPLGGIAAALRLATEQGHREVLTCGVDSVGLPGDLPGLLRPAPAYLEDQPVVGLWPIAASDIIADILKGSGRRSMRAFAHMLGARSVRSAHRPANVNTPADLAELEKRHGL